MSCGLVARGIFQRLLPGVLAATLAAAPGAAELVLLVDGGVLKVKSYHVSGEEIELDLPSGGILTLALLRVDRILADEIAEDTAVALPANGLEAAFSDSHRAPATPFAEEIMAAARRHRVNPQLIAAVVETESAFDPAAVSSKGAIGLMQLMPSTAQRFGLPPHEAFEPGRNLDVGTGYLRWLVDRFEGDLILALAGYNAGEAAVDRHAGVPPYRETREYIRRIYSAAGVELPAAATE